MRFLKNTDKINKAFQHTLEDLDAFLSTHPEIIKVVVIGRATDVNAQIESDEDMVYILYLDHPEKYDCNVIGNQTEISISAGFAQFGDNDEFGWNIKDKYGKGIVVFEK